MGTSCEYFWCIHRKNKTKWSTSRIWSATQIKSHCTHFKVEDFKNSPICFLMLLVWRFQFYSENMLNHWQKNEINPFSLQLACASIHANIQRWHGQGVWCCLRTACVIPETEAQTSAPAPPPLLVALGPKPPCVCSVIRPLLQCRIQTKLNRKFAIVWVAPFCRLHGKSCPGSITETPRHSFCRTWAQVFQMNNNTYFFRYLYAACTQTTDQKYRYM